MAEAQALTQAERQALLTASTAQDEHSADLVNIVAAALKTPLLRNLVDTAPRHLL